MKNALTALLVLVAPLSLSAQKHFVYTDAGLSLAYFDPGFSATYNYNLAKHIGLGAGVQGYVFQSRRGQSLAVHTGLVCRFPVPHSSAAHQPVLGFCRPGDGLLPAP